MKPYIYEIEINPAIINLIKRNKADIPTNLNSIHYDIIKYLKSKKVQPTWKYKNGHWYLHLPLRDYNRNEVLEKIHLGGFQWCKNINGIQIDITTIPDEYLNETEIEIKESFKHQNQSLSERITWDKIFGKTRP